MGGRNDVLTEEELSAFNINPAVYAAIDRFAGEMSSLPRERINILDWGCGRGRSVAKLREKGFSAYGVDVDDKTLRNGYDFFQSCFVCITQPVPARCICSAYCRK